MSMNWPPPDPAKADTERETRVSKLLTLEVSNSFGDRQKIVVRNLSPHGIGARSDLVVIACERLTLHMPNGQDIGATVRWVGKGTFGLALDERIEPDMLKPQGVATPGGLQPRDAELGFQRLLHTGSTQRAGFQRTHRDTVLNTSSWIAPDSKGRR